MYKVLHESPSGTLITAKCSECNVNKLISLNTNNYREWITGELIQKCFPKLPIEDRELLISGVCGKCFDKLFKEDEPFDFDDDDEIAF